LVLLCTCWPPRFASSKPCPDRTRIVLIIGAVGSFGFVLFAGDLYYHLTGEFYVAPLLMMWPLLNAFATALGMCSVALAFAVPAANVGVVTALTDSNSIVMTILSRVLLLTVPSSQKLGGMIATLIGCIVLAVCPSELQHSTCQRSEES
jgi:drug/metabolite transporter (DMT)-like permease